MHPTPTHCIVRIDVDKPKTQHCWEVKIIRPGNSFHRSFSDTKYGSNREAAYAAAVKCRDEELQKGPAMTSYELPIRPKKTNRSGIVGVRKGLKTVKRGKSVWEYPASITTGTPVSGGKSKTKYFVIALWGSSKAARDAAIAQRREWEDALRLSVQARLARESAAE